jgi:hypothetical protein
MGERRLGSQRVKERAMWALERGKTKPLVDTR